jgi:hypothetical protein
MCFKYLQQRHAVAEKYVDMIYIYIYIYIYICTKRECEREGQKEAAGALAVSET